jgi:hypothetical protein
MALLHNFAEIECLNMILQATSIKMTKSNDWLILLFDSGDTGKREFGQTQIKTDKYEKSFLKIFLFKAQDNLKTCHNSSLRLLFPSLETLIKSVTLS